MDSVWILWWCTFKNSTKILEVILMHLFKACHEDEYDKINELSNFKCNLFSCFNKLRDTADDLGWKKAFFRTWNSILNNNRNLNIQFNQLFFLSTMPHSNFKRFQIIYLVNAGKPLGLPVLSTALCYKPFRYLTVPSVSCSLLKRLVVLA